MPKLSEVAGRKPSVEAQKRVQAEMETVTDVKAPDAPERPKKAAKLGG